MRKRRLRALGERDPGRQDRHLLRAALSFFAKANAAAEQGTAAVIIANNQAGTINMNLTGYEYSAPAVSITQNDGYLLMGLGEQKEANGVTYYEGTLTISDRSGASPPWARPTSATRP